MWILGDDLLADSAGAEPDTQELEARHAVEDLNDRVANGDRDV